MTAQENKAIPFLLEDLSGNVLWITLNRPQQRNRHQERHKGGQEATHETLASHCTRRAGSGRRRLLPRRCAPAGAGSA